MALPKLENPKYLLKVPSTGQEVEYRPFSVKEQKILLLAKESQDQGQQIRAARDLIEACTFNQVDTNKITTFDFEYIFLMLRAKSVGETADISLVCTECDHHNELKVNLEQVKMTSEPEKILKVRLTDTVGIVFKYPGFKVAEAIEKMGGNEVEGTLEVVTACIDSIYDADDVYPAEEQSKEELMDFVESLSTAQFEKVVKIFEDMPKVSLEAEFTCSECGHHNIRTLEGLSNFF